ncbi:MAG: integration host factor subunit alpha [Alphaproteobacteria bacterium]|nr:MAG: integration host factor subunit alpha [Alphaproteobacteria bacterium]
MEDTESKTLTRAQLSEAIYRHVGLSRLESAELVEQMLEIVSQALENGENVKLSSFGAFNLRDKRQRVGRNPRTGKEVPILPRRVLSFRASHVLKARLNRTLARSGAGRKA